MIRVVKNEATESILRRLKGAEEHLYIPNLLLGPVYYNNFSATELIIDLASSFLCISEV